MKTTVLLLALLACGTVLSAEPANLYRKTDSIAPELKDMGAATDEKPFMRGINSYNSGMTESVGG
jgi:hypothetical protein